jgi:ketosteroid isomerase-like protein
MPSQSTTRLAHRGPISLPAETYLKRISNIKRLIEKASTMKSLEQRIQTLEDRQALQERVSSYLIALDDAADLEQLLSHFTEDAVFDMTALEYPIFEGMAALRELFAGAFTSMSHSAHYATNFKIDSLDQDTAAARTHVIGMGVPAEAASAPESKGSESVLFYVQYHLEFARINDSWKISSLRGQPLMPS